MGISKVEICYQDENGKKAVEVKITDDTATLQDLLDVWQPLSDDASLYKLYAEGQHQACRGCTVNCCNTAYVIPDLISFKKMALFIGLNYSEFVNRYFQREKLQVGLLRMRSNPCIFLRNNICTIYPIRSLICRFYLCCQLTADTEQLIYSLSWTGAAATQLFAEEKGLIKDIPGQGLSSFDMMFKKMIEEYRYKPEVQLFMQASEYNEIPLTIFKVGAVGKGLIQQHQVFL
jgi:hypothetical protein